MPELKSYINNPVIPSFLTDNPDVKTSSTDTTKKAAPKINEDDFIIPKKQEQKVKEQFVAVKEQPVNEDDFIIPKDKNAKIPDKPTEVTPVSEEPKIPLESINKPLAELHIVEIDKKIADIEKEINKVAREASVNPNMPNDRRAILNEGTKKILGLKAQKKELNDTIIDPIPEVEAMDYYNAQRDPEKLKALLSNPKISKNRIIRGIREATERAADAKDKQYAKDFENMGKIAFSTLADYTKNEDKTIPQKEADDLYIKIFKTPEYNDADYLKKQGIINKEIERHASTKEFATPEAKQKYVNEMRSAVGMRYAFDGEDEEGNPRLSIEGVKLLTEKARSNTMDYRNDLNHFLDVLKQTNPEYAKKLGPVKRAISTAFGIKNADDFLSYHYSEIHDLDKAIEAFDSVLAEPEHAKRGLRNFLPNLGSGAIKDLPVVGQSSYDAKNFMTLGFSKMFDTFGGLALVNKEKRGEELSYGEKQKLQVMATMAKMSGYDTKSWVYNLGSSVTAMLPYIATYGLTEPIYKAVMSKSLEAINASARYIIPEVVGSKLTNALTFKVAGKAAKVLGTESIDVFALAAKNLARVSGTVAQTIANPQMTATNIVQRMTPQIELATSGKLDPIIKILDGTQESFGEALIKGGYESSQEFFTERMGNHITGLFKTVGKAVGIIDINKIPKVTLLSKLMELKGVKSIDDLHIMKRLGWNGVVGEYFEELANQIMTIPVTPGGLGTGRQFLEQQLQTLGSVMLFSPGMKAVQLISEKTIGANVKFEFASKDPKTPGIKVSIPRTIYDGLVDLMDIKSTTDVDPIKLLDFIDKNKSKLNKDQLKVILMLSQNINQKKYAARVAEAGQAAPNPDITVADSNVNEPAKPINTTADKKKQIKVIEANRKEQLALVTTPEEKAKINATIDSQIEFINKQQTRTPKKVKSIIDGSVMKLDMTKDEITEMQTENERVITENRTLWDTGILRVNRSENRVIEPTMQSLSEDLIDTEEQLKEYTDPKYAAALTNPLGVKDAIPEEQADINNYLNLVARQDAIKNSLVDLNEKTRPYTDLSGEGQIQRLGSEITKEGKLTGISQKVGAKKFAVKLDDGRLVNFVLDADLSPEEKQKASEALKSGTAIEIKNRPSEEYDPEMNQTYDNGMPMQSKVTAYTPDGIRLGSAVINRSTDKQIERKEKNKIAQEKFKNQISSKIISPVVNKGPKLRSMTGPSQQTEPSEETMRDMTVVIKSAIETLIADSDEPITTFIDTLHSLVDGSDNAQEISKLYHDYIEQNKRLIIRKVINARTSDIQEQRDLAAAAGVLDINNIEFPEIEATFLSGKQKLDSQINTFGKIWRHIAEVTGISKDKVERTFFKLANTKGWEDVTNEAGYYKFLMDNIKGDAAANAIIRMFKTIEYSRAQSYFQFYRNIQLVAQIATIYNKKKLSFKTLNVSEKLTDFIDQARVSIDNFEYEAHPAGEPVKIYKGYDGIKMRLAKHEKEALRYFANYQDLLTKDLELLTKMRNHQYELDKKLLYDITGIPQEIWQLYFDDPKTLETWAIIDGENPGAKKINLKTIDTLLSTQTYRNPGKDKFARWHSELVFSLLYTRYEKGSKTALSSKDFIDSLDTFFFKGNEDKNVFSNLFKLATAAAIGEELGLAGQDVSNNRFSSIEQNNSIFYQLTHLDNIKVRTSKKQYIVNNSLKNPDGTKKLATSNSKTGKIEVNESTTLEEFFEYINGDIDSPTSRQKKMVIDIVEAQGYPTRSIITTHEDMVNFLYLHEKSHLDNNDQDNYWKVNRDLLSQDKIDIEVRATIDALKNIQEKKNSEKYKSAYQGSKQDIFDSRDINYFTLDADEAKDYGKVRKVFINTDGYLNVKNDEAISREFAEQFTKETGKTFDILDNSKFGLKTQKAYFEFLSSKGYKGYDTTGYSDSQYLISFDNKSVLKSKPKEEGPNELLAWLKESKDNISYFFLNGISDARKGNNIADKMTSSDILISLFSHFLQNEGTYNQWTGQYGDKTKMLMLKVPKYNMEQLADIKQDMKDNGIDLAKSIKFVYQNTVQRNSELFSDQITKYPGIDIDAELVKRIEHFILNFTKNIKDINEITRGNWSQYEKKGLVEFVKRGATSISPGMTLNSNIEGGIGQSYVFASFDDNILGVEKSFDGMCFFRGSWGVKLQTTLGTVYSKPKDYPILSSAKLLHAGIDPITGNEAITKANWINIDQLADEFGGRWAELRNFMEANGLDVASPKSSTKKHENGDKATISLWDKEGKVIKDPLVPEGGIVTRRTDQLLYQQDLRHSSKGKFSKTPSAIIGNIIGLQHGSDILEHMQEIQDRELKIMTDLFNSEETEAVKKKWLIENVNEDNNPQLLKLIKSGMSIHHPSFKNLISKVLASAVTKRVLEVQMMRITSQEILDVDRVLKGRRSSVHETGHIHLPEAMASIEGARESNPDYIGKTHLDKKGETLWDAIEFVKANKAQFLDLYDEKGKLMEWIIIDNDGEIPGEPFVSVRVPTDDYHSFTVARLKKNIKSGNFTMLDHESQMASGSDADGDQRFNLLLSKTAKGNIHSGTAGSEMTNDALNNMIIMDLVYDYQHPANDIRIKSSIEVNQFDDIIKDALSEFRSEEDIQAYFRARAENIVGLTMKGIFTDLLTTVNILQKYPLQIFDGIVFNGQRTDRIVHDEWGMLKLALSNIQNMGFDNATEPRIEHLGFNEHTSPMIFTLLITNDKLDSSHFRSEKDPRAAQLKVIMEEVKKIKDVFTGPIAIDFRDYMREEKDALSKKDPELIWEKLHKDYDILFPGAVDEFRGLHTIGTELDSIRKYYALSRNAPENYSDFRVAKTLDSIMRNGLKHFNTRAFFVRSEWGKVKPIGVFAMIPKILDILEDTIYADTLDETPVGKLIHNKIESMYESRRKAEKFGRMRSQDYAAIGYSLNAIATIRGIGLKGTFRSIEKQVIESINDIRSRYPGNKFFAYTQKVETTSKLKTSGPVSYKTRNLEGKEVFVSFEIDPQFHHAPISEKELQDIRDDFDKLDEDTQDLLTTYALYKWGPAMTRSRGSYMSFLGDQYQVVLSQFAMYEYEKWESNGLSNIEINNILQWTVKTSRSKRILPFETSTDYLIDINAIPNAEIAGITPESLEELSLVTEQKGYDAWILKHNINVEEFEAEAIKRVGLSEKGRAQVVKYSKSILAGRKEEADRLFPPQASSSTLKSMMLYDTEHSLRKITDVLLSDDPELMEWTYQHLAKIFPDVEFFKDRQKFFDFMAKHEGSFRDASPDAIGHAFRNAVFINEGKAVQEAIIHEFAHIYWDGLPDTNKAKQAIQKLYNDTFSAQMEQDDIDELIIIDIGRAGNDYANLSLRGTALDKFMNHLTQLWIDVKRLFGKANRYDLVRDLAWDVWRNAENIKPSTAEGVDILRTLVEFPRKEEAVAGDPKNNSATVGNKKLSSPTGVLNENKDFAFDTGGIAGGKQDKLDFMYFELTGKHINETEAKIDAQNLQRHWIDTAEEGTSIHMIAQSVLDYESLSDDDKKELVNLKKNNFTQEYLFDKTQDIFEQIKQIILDKYDTPERKYSGSIEFISEKEVVSRKYEMHGIIDLVVDLGTSEEEVGTGANKKVRTVHHLIVVDFKTTPKAFAEIEEDTVKGTFKKVLVKSYTDAMGTFKGLFSKVLQSHQIEHEFQLNMYKNMLEEQSDDPGNNDAPYNKVEALMIFPIIRGLDIDGRIDKVDISPHVDVSIKPEAAFKMMANSFESRKEISKEGIAYGQKLRDIGYGETVIKIMLKALSLFQTYTNGNILGEKDNPKSGLWWKVADSMRGGMYTTMIQRLYSYGYLSEDIKSMPIEHLIYTAFVEHGISKEEYTKNIDTYFPEVELEPFYKSVLNPEHVEHTWYHFNHKGKDVYAREIGYETTEIDVGTKVGLYINIEKPTGTTTKVYKTEMILGKIIAIDRNLHTFTIDTEDGTTVTVSPPNKTAGLLEIFTAKELPQTPKKMGIQKDSFVPRYLTTLVVEKERHYKQIGADHFKDSQAHIRYKSDLKKIWAILASFSAKDSKSPVDDLGEILDNKDKLNDLYNRIREMDPNAAGILTKFVGDIARSHNLTDRIKEEYVHGKEHLMHIMFQYYLSLTNNDNILFTDFDRSFFSGRGGLNVPVDMIGDEFVGLNAFTAMTTQATRRYNSSKFEIQLFMKKIKNKFNFADAYTENAQGEMYYKRPSEVDERTDPALFQFLSFVYERYYEMDSRYQGHNENSIYKKKILVRKTFAATNELSKEYNISRRWSARFRNMMSTSPYDEIRVPKQRWDNLKKLWVNDDIINPNTGKVITPAELVTVKSIKDNFMYEHMDNDERRKFFGDWIEHRKKLPGQRLPKLRENTNAELLRYYYLADKIIKHGGDAFNRKSMTTQHKLTVRGSTTPMRYNTLKFFDNEESIMISMVKAYYMKPCVSEMDYYAEMYRLQGTEGKSGEVVDNKSVVSKYIQDWGNFVIYDEKIIGGRLQASNREIHDLVDFMNTWVSYAKIWGTVKTQFYNLAAGQASAWLRYPKQNRIGIRRVFSSPRKAFGILKRYGLANFVDQLEMEKVEREVRIGPVPFGWVGTIGFWLVESIEKVNQVGTYIGHMTETEWNSYDSEARIIRGQERNVLSEARQDEIAEKVYQTQGHYGVMATAPGWLSPTNKAMLGLKKYLPAYYWNLAAGYVQKHGMVTSGILPTVDLLLRIINWNYNPVGVKDKKLYNKNEEYKSAIKRDLQLMASKSNNDIEYFEKNTADVMDRLRVEMENNHISFKQLSNRDKSNLYTLLRSMGLFVAGNMALAWAGGGDDDDKLLVSNWKGLIAILTRFMGDSFVFTDPKSVVDFLTRLAPPTIDLVKNLMKLASSLTYFAEYKFFPKKFPYAKEKALYINPPNEYIHEGDARFVTDFLRIIGGGNAVAQFVALGTDAKLHTTFITEQELRENGIDKTVEDKIMIRAGRAEKFFNQMAFSLLAKEGDTKISISKFKSLRPTVDQTLEILRNYYKFITLDKKNISPVQYEAQVEGMKELRIINKEYGAIQEYVWLIKEINKIEKNGNKTDSDIIETATQYKHEIAPMQVNSRPEKIYQAAKARAEQRHIPISKEWEEAARRISEEGSLKQKKELVLRGK